MRQNDTWKAIVEVASKEAETAEYLLSEAGALGSIEEETGLPEKTRIAAFFEKSDIDCNALRDRIADLFASFPELAGSWIEVEVEEARDWNAKWRELFKPFELASNVVIVPSWESYEAKPGDRIIHIDPGMAFGTGLHETTSLCAEALLELSGSTLDGASLLDVGTGSGILSILGRLLGMSTIVGVDIDEDALDVARENIAKNDCDDISLVNDISQVEGEFDVVIANILLFTLLDLSEPIVKRVAPGGFLILSGITHDQEETILDAYGKYLIHIKTERRGEWSAIVMRRVQGNHHGR